MKKIIVALGVAAMALGFTACDKSGSTSGASGSSNDSLSILLGDVQGASYLAMWDQMPDTMKAKLNKDEFISGFKAVIDRDYKDDQSYLMGVSVAMQLMNNLAQLQDAGVPFDKNVFISHFSASFKKDSVDQKQLDADNSALRIYMNEANELIMKKQQAEQQRMMQEAQAAAEGNIKAGKEYVEKQKKADPSIKTTESGVSYKVISEGSGTKPTKKDMVKVNYVGKHIDGTEFDSSNGTPRQFSVSGVVPGFSEILQLMSPGAKYVAYIPSDKAYGVSGTQNIKPGETLVFEIELVEVAGNESAK